MTLFTSELSRYASLIESSLNYTIPQTLEHYGEDMRKSQIHSFILQGGKRLRPALAMMMADELWYTSSESCSVFSSLEIFHDFILSHDDIIDQDNIRRGNDTLHIALQKNLPGSLIKDRHHFGHAQAIIGGDVMYALAQDMILDSDIKSSRKITLIKILSTTLQDVARWWYKQFLSDYLSLSEISLDYIIQHNLIEVTSSYSFLFPLQFGQAIATGDAQISPELREFANNLGILFQTGDDIIGLFGDPAVTGKSADGDIIQGKKTIPMYMTYTHAPVDEQHWLNERLWKDDLTDTEIIRIKQLVTDYGLTPTKEFLADYAERCRHSLDLLPYSDHWKSLFASLIEYLMKREF